MKSIKANKQFHSSDKKIGMGDSYGSGVKNKVGKVKEIMGSKPLSKSKIGKPPKALA